MYHSSLGQHNIQQYHCKQGKHPTNPPLKQMPKLASSLDLLRSFFLSHSLSYLAFPTATWFG